MTSALIAPLSTDEVQDTRTSGPITSVAIVGGGFMGAGIAECAALAGIPVVVYELPEYLDAARQRLEGSLERAVSGECAAADRDSALARTTLTSELADVADAEFVVEAVPENVELKTSIMKALGGIVADDAVIASNTSSIPIAQLASAVSSPRARGRVALFLPSARDAPGRDRARPRHQRRDGREGP